MDHFDESERRDIWGEAHPGCERCGDPVCVAQADGAHEDDCICHGAVPSGVRVEGDIYCGQVCADAFRDDPTPLPCMVETTEKIPVTVCGVVYPCLRDAS